MITGNRKLLLAKRQLYRQPYVKAAAPPPPGPFVEDQFDSVNLGSHWTFVNPKGNCSYNLTGDRLEITAPPGQGDNNNDIWHDVRDVGWMKQACLDEENLNIKIKFFSEPTLNRQKQGILIEQDDQNWIKCEMYHTGSKLRLFTAKTINDSSSTVDNEDINNYASSSTHYVLIEKTGTSWAIKYSNDDTNWITAKNFTHSLTISAIGPYAGTASYNSAGITTEIDYFIEV